MRVHLLYFAAIRDLLGRATEELDLPDGPHQLADVRAALARAHPELAERLGTVRFALNEAFAEPDASVSDGDAVAVIPPVSGG
jgi:molybdopterin converting factor subunit 1